MTAERWKSKSDALAEGWIATFGGAAPTTRTIALALSVAQHETRCGDAWPGEHNWGAIQKRKPTVGEFAVLTAAKLEPTPSNAWLPTKEAPARVAIAAAVAKGTIPLPLTAALHVDSSPGKPGWYWMWFWAFDTEAEGAALFCKVLAKQRPSCKLVLEDPDGTPEQLARAMYVSRYYEGFKSPKAWFLFVGEPARWTEVPAGTPDAIQGSELNIADYGSALRRIFKEVLAAFEGRTLRLGDVGSDVGALMLAIGAEAELGPKAIEVLKVWQKAHGLKGDGVCGPLTRAALAAAGRDIP